MPRQSRKNLTGEFFHLIVQGINKERIFESDKMVLIVFILVQVILVLGLLLLILMI